MNSRVTPNRKYCFPVETCDKNRGGGVRQDEQKISRDEAMGVPPYLAGRIPPLVRGASVEVAFTVANIASQSRRVSKTG